MKVLPIVLAAAASGQQVSDEATAAWASVQQTGINLYNGVLAAYENKNIPPVRKGKVIDRLIAKVQNFALRSTTPCDKYAGSGNPADFVPSVFDENDICQSINDLISSLLSYQRAFVCMDGLTPQQRNEWAPIKMRRLLHRQRKMLLNNKFKQLGCAAN